MLIASPATATATAAILLLSLASADAFQMQEKVSVSPPETTTKRSTRKNTLKLPANVKTIVPKEIPMPFKWPIIGNLPDFYARGGVDGYAEVHESMYRDYGAVYGMSLVGEDMLVVSDPTVYDQVLKREGVYPIGASESVSTFVEYYTENDMEVPLQSLSHGADWKEWRQKTNPDLYVLWDTYLPTIADACSKISQVAGRETTEEKNLHFAEFISRAAFDMFSAVLFGESPRTTDTQVATQDDVEFVTATQTAFDITGKLMTNPMEKVFGSSLYQKFVVSMDKVFGVGKNRSVGFAEDALRAKNQREREAAIPSSSDSSSDSSTSDSISESSSGGGCPVAAIQSIVATTKGGLNRNKVIPTNFLNPSFIERIVDRDVYSIDEIGQISAPLLMAGVDTTAYVMGWFYLNLASNPGVQTKLAEELREQLGGADVTTSEQLESLTYLKACFRETHRLTPSSPILTKTLTEDIDLLVVTNTNTNTNTNNGNNNNKNGHEQTAESYRAPAGQRICLNLRAFPMDPKYVDNPRDFEPERFLPEAVEARKGTPSEILDHPYFENPFGRGKRRCLGANVAVAEMMVLAARLVQDWEIALEDPSQAVGSPTKTWKPKQKLMLKADPYPALTMVSRK